MHALTYLEFATKQLILLATIATDSCLYSLTTIHHSILYSISIMHSVTLLTLVSNNSQETA